MDTCLISLNPTLRASLCQPWGWARGGQPHPRETSGWLQCWRRGPSGGHWTLESGLVSGLAVARMPPTLCPATAHSAVPGSHPAWRPPRQSLPSASTAPLSDTGLKSCSLPGSLEQAFSGLVSSAPCPTAPALLTNPPHPPLLFLCPSVLTDAQSSLPTRAGAWSELGLGPHPRQSCRLSLVVSTARIC